MTILSLANHAMRAWIAADHTTALRLRMGLIHLLMQGAKR
jgi:hypothetical protein